MSVLLFLVTGYLITILMGKYIRKPNFLSLLFLGLLVGIQVAFLLFFMYTMEVPTP